MRVQNYSDLFWLEWQKLKTALQPYFTKVSAMFSFIRGRLFSLYYYIFSDMKTVEKDFIFQDIFMNFIYFTIGWADSLAACRLPDIVLLSYDYKGDLQSNK